MQKEMQLKGLRRNDAGERDAAGIKIKKLPAMR